MGILSIKCALCGFCMLAILSCGKPDCINANPIFDEYGSEQIEYKEELIKVMDTRYDDLDFWLTRYMKDDNGEFIEVQVSGDNICANALLQVTDWTKMKGIQETRGRAFSGAQLVDLKFKFDGTDSSFVFLDLDRVVDSD